MNPAFCTIITANYFPFALALYKSIRKFNPDIQFHILIADNHAVDVPMAFSNNIRTLPVKDILHYSLVNQLHKRYASVNTDFFRWSLKPVFISYLLENGHSKVIYTDCDIFFFDNYDFLFDSLDEASVLLTPHWWNTNVNENEESFVSFFSYGIFNAGFIGVSKKGLPAMEWWAKACYFKIGFFPESGIFLDQKYLDAFPFKFPGTEVVRHCGCNIGEWNTEECKRTIVNDRVLINEEYPIVFIHFTQTLIQQILKGFDPLLKPYFQQYMKTFEEDGTKLSNFDPKLDAHLHPGAIRKIRWTLRIRTRFKSFLFRIARSL